MIRDVDERRKGGELHSSDRLQQKPTWEHPHARGADECANVDMERTTNAAREGEKVSSARWAFTLEALQIDGICTALSPFHLHRSTPDEDFISKSVSHNALDLFTATRRIIYELRIHVVVNGRFYDAFFCLTLPKQEPTDATPWHSLRCTHAWRACHNRRRRPRPGRRRRRCFCAAVKNQIELGIREPNFSSLLSGGGGGGASSSCSACGRQKGARMASQFRERAK